MERGKRKGRLHLSGPAKLEAEGFMATVHGAMLSARAYGDPRTFRTITRPLLDRLSATH
jgi:TetR/AcrR family transcriptional repressor of nem operon